MRKGYDDVRNIGQKYMLWWLTNYGIVIILNKICNNIIKITNDNI